MNKRLKTVPEFSSEAEERAFWEAPDNDSSGYFDSPNLVGLLLECRGFDHRAHGRIMRESRMSSSVFSGFVRRATR
jgi:hypothetical protein